MFDDEAALLPSFRGTQVAELVAKASEGEEEAVEKAVAALEPGTPEDDKDRVSKVNFTGRVAYRRAARGFPPPRFITNFCGNQRRCLS